MALYTTTHLHNVVKGREADYAQWFDGPHREALARLRGFRSADRFEVTAEQVMPDVFQPWRFLSVYEFDYPAPEIDLPALGPLLAEARDAGLIDDTGENERIYSYRMYYDWISSVNHQKDKPFSGVYVIPANFVPGREAEYHKWYDEVHLPEVCRTPGFVAMKRGRLSDVQIEPKRFCPGSELVICAQQTDELLFSIKDFIARAYGTSPGGEQMVSRSSSGSLARTVHFFTKISGTDFWDGNGIAYAGDLSLYPPDFRNTPL